MPKCLSRRVEMILIKRKHLLKESEHFIFQKGKAGGREGGRWRKGNTRDSEHRKYPGAAGVGCYHADMQRVQPFAAAGHPYPLLMGKTSHPKT